MRQGLASFGMGQGLKMLSRGGASGHCQLRRPQTGLESWAFSGEVQCLGSELCQEIPSWEHGPQVFLGGGSFYSFLFSKLVNCLESQQTSKYPTGPRSALEFCWWVLMISGH